MGKTVTNSFIWENLQQMTQLTEQMCKWNNLTLAGFPLSWGYIHVYNHRFQRSFSLKLLSHSYPNFMWRPPWEDRKKVYIYINGPGHMTKMAAMPIYGANLQNLFLQN